MPNYVSPGVYTVEKDISEYSPSINPSVVGIVGFASKGPTNKATLITSHNQLNTTFGEPNENIYGQGLEGALKILDKTNQLYFIRAADSTASAASAAIPFGGCPAVAVSSNGFGLSTALYLRLQSSNGTGTSAFETNALGKRFDIPTNTIPSGDANSTQGLALKTILHGGGEADAIGCYFSEDDYPGSQLSGLIVGKWAGSGAWMTVEAFSSLDSNGNLGQGAHVIRPLDGSGNVSGYSGFAADEHSDGGAPGFCSAIKIWGTQLSGLKDFTGQANNLSGLNYAVEAIYAGDGYNEGATPTGGTSGVSVKYEALGGEGLGIFSVYSDGEVAESFRVSLVASGGNFWEQQINTGSTDLKSDYIKGNVVSSNIFFSVSALNNFTLQASALGTDAYAFGGVAPRFLSGLSNGTFDRNANNTNYVLYGDSKNEKGLQPRFAKAVEGTFSLAHGTGGSTGTDSLATALIGSKSVDPKTGMQGLDDDTLNISIATVPGVHIQSVQNALISLAEDTQNFIAVLSPPYAIGTVQNAIEWTNGQTTSRTAAINSSYAALYWPWVQTFSVADGKNRWFDPAIYGVMSMCNTDDIADPWFAPAGMNRALIGNMGAENVEVKVNQGDRNTMYSGGNALNPIVGFVPQGIMIFGQRTAQRKPTALDRINIRRLMIFIRKSILSATRQFVFEPNDAFTWERIAGVLNPFMDNIKMRRGITEFRVVCDETVNTPVRVDRNEMWCKVLVKPTKTAEMVVFELNVTNQSADLG
jgi:phage tail sheath protein FI